MGVNFGGSFKDDEDQGDNYLTAAMSARVNGTYNDVVNHIKSSLFHLGHPRIVQIPSHETDNYVGLYGPDHEHSYLKESIKDASGAILVYAPITTRILTQTIKKRTKKDDLVLNSVGYVVYPDGN